MKEATEWYLKKKNSNEYGPVSLKELARWAEQCRIVAGNQISQDRKNWTPVEEIPALQMDWFAERQDGKRYGPFPLPAISALVEHDVLPDDAQLTNPTTGETLSMVEALAQLSKDQANQKDHETAADTSTMQPAEKPSKPHHMSESSKALQPSTQSIDRKQVATPNSGSKPEEAERMSQFQQEISALKQQINDLLHARNKQESEAEQHVATLQTEFETVKQQAAEQHQQAQIRQQELATQVEDLQEALQKAQETNKSARPYDHHQENLIAELRQQVAFMKKNTAALHAQLTTAKETAKQRAKMLAGAWMVVTIVTAALLLSLLARGCQRSPQDRPATRQETRSGETDRLSPVTDRDATSDRESHADASDADPLPTIEIEGIQVLSQDTDRLSLRFEEGIFSSLDTLSADGRQLLDELARILPRNLAGWTLVIEGHTDDIPMRSTSRFADNEALAEARAKAASQHFIQRAGFPEENIRTDAGSTAPFPNDSAANRQRNRTITIEILRR